MEFKDALREARKEKGLTQSEIAEAMNITKSTYCGYETGKRQPDVMKIKQISEILGIPADRLLQTGHEDAQRVSAKEQSMIDLFRQMTPEEKAMAEIMLKSLLDSRK